MIKMIVAVDENNLIGKGGLLPWNIPKELAFFKKSTSGHSLMMGRKTLQYLPGKLPNRTTFCLSRKALAERALQVELMEKCDYISDSPEDIFDEYRNSEKTLFIAGGKFIYEKYYKEADEIIVSRIKHAYEGKAYLKINLSQYNEELILEEKDFNVYKYTKK